jgi:hypothetical protein
MSSQTFSPQSVRLSHGLPLLCLIATAAVASAQPAIRASAPAEPAGMIRMFNGTNLTGWDGDPRLWSVKAGVIRGETTAENRATGNTFLIWTNGIVKDFELRCAFRCSAVNNSGIQYRSALRPIQETNPNKWRVAGYQAEVRNETNLPNLSGFIYDEGGRRGRMCLVGEKAVWENGRKNVQATICTPEEFNAAFKLHDWNEYIIVARGNHIQHYINGLQVIDFTDQDPALALKEGIVALQIHGGQPMWVEFKDLRVKHYE